MMPARMARVRRRDGAETEGEESDDESCAHRGPFRRIFDGILYERFTPMRRFAE
jgi:hypothetical protein